MQILILDIHAAEEIVGNDVEGRGFRVGSVHGMVADAADEAAALNYDVDVGGHEKLDAAAEGVDVNFLVLGNHGLAQIQSDSAAEGVESCTMEGLTAIDVLVAAVVYRTADALAVLADGQGAMEPLVRVATVAVDDQMYTNIEYHKDAEISCPGLFGDLCKPTPMDKAPDGGQLQQAGYDENNTDNRSWSQRSAKDPLRIR